MYRRRIVKKQLVLSVVTKTHCISVEGAGKANFAGREMVESNKISAGTSFQQSMICSIVVPLGSAGKESPGLMLCGALVT